MVEPSIWQRAVRVETLRPGAETRGGASVVPAGFWRSPSLCALQDSLMHIAARHLDIDQGATARTQNTDGTGFTPADPASGPGSLPCPARPARRRSAATWCAR